MSKEGVGEDGVLIDLLVEFEREGRKEGLVGCYCGYLERYAKAEYSHSLYELSEEYKMYLRVCA
jgi:hypothetical protein